MNQKDREIVANELVKVAKDLVSAATPDAAYKHDENRINVALNRFSSNWNKLDKLYKQQLKASPESWRGLGRGSELSDLANELVSVEVSMSNILRNFR